MALAVAAVVSVALVGGSLTPASADESAQPPSGGPVVGPFAVGDELEAAVDERDGALKLAIPVAGLQLDWDSRALALDRYALAAGWSFGLGAVQVEGGVRVFPASGGAYDADASQPSGLAGRLTSDVVFATEAGLLPARSDGAVDAQPYRYALHEAGGVSTYFDVSGDPVARVTAAGDRDDWRWDHEAARRRLLEVVNAAGVVTTLDWESEPATVLVRPASNVTEPRAGAGGLGVWRIRLDERSGVVGVIDPHGVEAGLETDASGLVTALRAPSGADTTIDWRAFDDGTARVDRVAVADRDGVELSSRFWAPAPGESGLSTSWPAREPALTAAGVPQSFAQTVLSDGVTEVRSRYSSHGVLTSRALVTSSGAGERTLQELAFGYPGGDDGDDLSGDPNELSANWARPDDVTVVHHGASGATRAVRQEFAFDERGRLVAQSSADGSRTELEYDTVVPEPRPARPGAVGMPVGLPVVERRIGADGSVTETRSELNATRTTPTAVDEFTGRVDAGGRAVDLVPTGRSEREVADDGFVTEERVYPAGDRSATPRVTRWSRQIDLGSGEVTTTETRHAGVPGAGTTSRTISLAHGGVLTQSDALGNRSSTSFDELGRVLRMTDVLGRTSQHRYEHAVRDDRNATTITGADGVAATEVRDELGRVVQLSDNIDHGVVRQGHVRVAETRVYPEPGETRVTDAWGAITTSRLDVLGRTIERRTPTGLVERTDYDDVANEITTAFTPTGLQADAETVRTSRLDDAGRIVDQATSRADGVPAPATHTEYDDRGRPVLTSTGALETRTEYDVFGNASKVAMTAVAPDASDGTAASSSPAAATVPASAPAGMLLAERRFDGFGRSVEKTLSDETSSRSGGIRSLDALGRITRVTDPAGGVATSTFTVDGLVERTIAASGQVSEYTYDPATRSITSEIVTSPHGATVATGYAYDELTGDLTAIWDLADPDGSRIAYERDAHGDLLRVTYPDGRAVRHEYDPHGRRVATTDIAGNRTTFAWDAAGLLAAAEQRDDEGRRLAGVRATYDAFGRVAELVRDNGVRTEYTFTSTSRPASETTTTADGEVQSERRYVYDERDQLTSRTDLVAGRDGVAETASTSYEYDPLGRLVSSTRRDGLEADSPATVRTDYDVTASLDLAAETITERPGTPEARRTVREFGYAPLGELIDVTTTGPGGAERRTQEYDAAANLTRALDGTIRDYDAANRQVAETRPDGTSVATTYWADGTRRDRTVRAADGTTSATRFYWDGGALVNDEHLVEAAAEGEVAESGVASYLIGASRLARTAETSEGISTTYYGTDRHGNVTELTDEAGELAARYEYDDYGRPTRLDADAQPVHHASAHDGVAYNPFQYAGEFTDRRGVQHLGSRYYDPESHRFQSLDPADQHNRFGFANLNPIMMVDPTGRTPDWDTVVNGSVAGIGVLAAALVVISTAVSAATGGIGFFAALGVVGGVSLAADTVAAGLALSVVVLQNAFRMQQGDPLITGLQWGETVLGLGALWGTKLAGKALSKSSARVTPPGPAQPVPTLSEAVPTLSEAELWARKINEVYWFHGTSKSGAHRIIEGREGLVIPERSVNGWFFGKGVYLGDLAEAQKWADEAGDGVVLIVKVQVQTAKAYALHYSGVTETMEFGGNVVPWWVAWQRRTPDGKAHASPPPDKCAQWCPMGRDVEGDRAQLIEDGADVNAKLIHKGDFLKHHQVVIHDTKYIESIEYYNEAVHGGLPTATTYEGF